jgi:isoleucyl-tRNA synthetase
VQKLLENHRAEGRIGSSLQAEVEIAASGERLELLQSLGDDLRFVLITSRATVTAAASETEEEIRTVPSPHRKCERCWHWRADVGADPKHPEICGRCVQNLFGAGEPRQFA